MKLWDKTQALYEVIDELTPIQQKLISNVIEHGDPNDLYSELTERQVRWIHWLYAKYIDGIERPEW